MMGKLRPTVLQIAITLVSMIINRQNLRTLYLQESFQLDQLQVSPQYSVLFLFLIIFIIGLWSVWYMVKAALSAKEGRAA
jgi:hypothetical protein